MKILKDSWRLEHYNLMRTYIGSKIGKVLKQELPLANELVASRLEIEVGARVIELQRLRGVNDEFISYDTTCLPYDN